MNINPYSILKIDSKSSSYTIKEAYKSFKKSEISPSKKEVVEQAFSMIKTDLLRARYRIISNRPYSSLNDIKSLGNRPRILETSQWIDYLL